MKYSRQIKFGLNYNPLVLPWDAIRDVAIKVKEISIFKFRNVSHGPTEYLAERENCTTES